MTVFRLNLLEVAAKVGTPSAAPSRYFVRAWIALALCATACGTTPAATDAPAAIASIAGARHPTLVASAAEAPNSAEDSAGLDAMLTAIQAAAPQPLPGHGAKTP